MISVIRIDIGPKVKKVQRVPSILEHLRRNKTPFIVLQQIGEQGEVLASEISIIPSPLWLESHWTRINLTIHRDRESRHPIIFEFIRIGSVERNRKEALHSKLTQPQYANEPIFESLPETYAYDPR